VAVTFDEVPLPSGVEASLGRVGTAGVNGARQKGDPGRETPQLLVETLPFRDREVDGGDESREPFRW
jgi:hypothetical protein